MPRRENVYVRSGGLEWGVDWSWALGALLGCCYIWGGVLRVGINRVSKGRWGRVGMGCHSVYGWAGTRWDREGWEAKRRKEGGCQNRNTIFVYPLYGHVVREANPVWLSYL